MSPESTLGQGRTGIGAPMLLLHGLGHRRQVWQPVIELLVDDFEMIAQTCPGLVKAPLSQPARNPRRRGSPITWRPCWMRLAGTAHTVGNSLGGWVALELACRGRGGSVTALMPAGLWRRARGSDSLRHRALFGLWSGMAHLPGALRALRNSFVRTLTLAGAFGRPWRIPADVASGHAMNLRRSDMRRTQQAVAGGRFTGGRSISVPVEVVLGTRDPLTRRRDLDLNEMPPHTRITTLPGAGHVPTWDDPEAVAATIVDTIRRTSSASGTCASSARYGDGATTDDPLLSPRAAEYPLCPRS